MTTDIEATHFVSRPRNSDRLTRKPLPWWDRVKILAVLALVFGLSVWGEVGDNPILPVREAFNATLRNRWWLLVLMGLELLRQIHYVVAEHNSAYYLWWRRRFARINARVEGIGSWTRFRLGRLVNFFLLITALTDFVAWRSDTP